MSKRELTYYLKDGSIYTKTSPYIWDIEDLNTERLHDNKFITFNVDNALKNLDVDDDVKKVLVLIDDIEKIELREIEDTAEEE